MEDYHENIGDYMEYNYNDTEEDFDDDEKVMSDLHLGNAINLDTVEYFVNGKFTEYNIFVPRFRERLWEELKEHSFRKLKTRIGLLECSQEILLYDSPKTEMNQVLYKKLISIVAQSLKKRNYIIPIVMYESELLGAKLIVNSLYLSMFRFLLKMVCMSSEATREGSRSRYKNIRINGETVSGGFVSHTFSWRVKCNNQFCSILDKKKNVIHYGNFDSLLLLLDTLGQRLCLEIGITICKAARVVGTPLYKEVFGLIRVGDSILQSYGNNGYEVIAMFESLVVATILKKNPDLVTDNSEFINNCREEIEDMVSEGMFDEGVLGYFDLMADFLMEIDEESLSNIFCVYRIWGHPRVDIKQGMRKVMDKGTATKPSPSGVPRIIANQFKKMFVTGYYEKHHKYPPVSFSTTADHYIRSCITSGSPIAVDHYSYCFYDWDSVQCKQLWTVPRTYDVCHILNDKAVSPDRSEIVESIKNEQGTVLGGKRRGIIRWLLGESLKCKEFLDYIDKYGLDEDSLIIGMYEKEREIKIKARMFSLMSEKMRMYFVLTEELMAEHLLKYFPQITMKDPLHVWIKKLWAVSGHSSKNSLDPVINIDFEKWNLNFRDDLTNQIFAVMDGLFGYTNLISRTHEIFYNSFIYSCSGVYLPKVLNGELVIDPPMCYTYHQGGFEGLRQKGWTIATVCLLCYLADNLKISMSLLGQGDNQVVRLYMPDNYWNNLVLDDDTRIFLARLLLERYLQNMNTYFSIAGLPIKLRETWTSTRLCMYGKNMFLDGRCLPQWVKKLLRSYALSNEGTLTVSGVIGTLATNMSAAAHASTSPDIMYVLFLILGEWSLEFLLAYHPFTRETIKEGMRIEFNIASNKGQRTLSSGRINRHRLIVTLLMIPTSVGGSITIPLTSYIMRGFPDHGTEGYSWLKLLYSVKSEFSSLFRNWYTFLKNDTIEYDMLVQSPWSLNHKKPPTPALQSRDAVRSWLMSGQFDKNTFIKGVQRIMSNFDRKVICGKFCTEAINPLILNELYNTFPQVYLDSIMCRVEKTRTMTKIALKMGARKPIVKPLMEMEHEFLGYLYWRGCKTGTIFSDCATEQCRNARNVGWGREIKGLTTPHPLEFALNHQCNSDKQSCDGSDYIYARVNQLGKYPPYLGSKVKTKVSSIQDIAARTEPLISTSAKLARLAPWLKLGPNAKEVLFKNVSLVCDTSIFESFFDEDSTFYSGSVEHRFNPACSSEGCFINYSPQIGSKVFLSTDNMPRYGKGQTNVTLNFQALFCFLQYGSARRIDTTSIHYHLSCETCIREVDEEITDIEDFSDLLDRLYNPEVCQELQATLGYLAERPEQVIQTEQFSQKAVLKMINPDETRIKSLQQGITWLLSLRAGKIIMCGGKGSSSLIRQEDLQAFPRVYGYKISSIKIITCVAAACLAVKHGRMKLNGESDLSFNNIKRKLRGQILKMTLEHFKGVSSLCVGRTFDMENGERPSYMNNGEFPESVGGLTSAVKTEILSKLDSMNCFLDCHERWEIPLAGVSIDEQMLLLKIRLLGNYDCKSCIESLSIREENIESHSDCGEGHIRRELRKCIGLMHPVDTMIKMLSIKSTTLDPECVFDGSIVGGKLIWRYQSPVKEASQTVKFEIDPSLKTFLSEKELVILPTRAAYKWDVMMSQLQRYDYNNVVVLGDGTGFTSCVAARRFPMANIFPTGLLEDGKMIPQDLKSIKPFASRIYTNVKGSLLENVADDITDPKWFSEFLYFLSTLRGSILLISDIEGVGDVEKALEKMLQELSHSTEVDLLIKVYFRTFETLLDLGSYSNWFCNLTYQEGFVSNIEIDSFTIKSCSDEVTISTFRSMPETELEYWIDMFHENYNELYGISIKIASNVLHRNLVPFDKRELNYSKNIILIRYLNYLSASFKVPYEGTFQGDNRRLLDGMMIRLIKSSKIMLMILFGQRVKHQNYFKHLGIAKADKRDRHPKLRMIQTFLVETDKEIELTNKEESAGKVLRAVYLRSKTSVEDSLIPKSLAELYTKHIIPGIEEWNMVKEVMF